MLLGLALFSPAAFALSLREIPSVRIGKENQSTYGVSVAISPVIGFVEQYYGRQSGDTSHRTYSVKITVPKKVDGSGLERVDVSVVTTGTPRMQISASIATEDEGDHSSATVFMIAETIKIADVSVHYGSVKFFYSIDLSSYLKSAENDGANQSTEATPSACTPAANAPVAPAIGRASS